MSSLQNRSNSTTPAPAAQATHMVTNQPPPLASYNAYARDAALVEAVAVEGGGWGREQLSEYGRIAGHELDAIGFAANDNPPVLQAFDRFGHRIDNVQFHPAYHRSMALARAHGLHSLTWTATRPGAQVVRSALFYLHAQFEAGSMCPTTMTHASVPALRQQPELAEHWLPGVLADSYDPSDAPAARKTGLSIGMGMTEKQGGTDVRANTTQATAVAGGPGAAYELIGHKWFLSAPMSDAFLVLAQTARESEQGPSCFLLPRWRDDGTRNSIEIQRLKNKLGDRSNASAEVEFRGAQAFMLGAPGRGINTILSMVAQTRLDCMLGSAGLMRQALVQAIHHCRYRHVFGKPLLEQPLMQNVLADMALEVEAAIALALRLARAFESADEHEQLLARIATPVGKYWICKRAPSLINEAQECLGGNGYIEESILPRLYRQAPVNSIWEGSGNVQCLDLLRAVARKPQALAALHAELEQAHGLNAAYDAHCARLRDALADTTDTAAAAAQARRLCTDIALAFSASILLRRTASTVGHAFCRARLAERHGMAFGTLPLGVDCCSLIERAAAM